ncbi:MAG: polymer-forming cytoskeletal protein [Spirochaetia bacterium]|nr:polymer-forming cytoskeletal protein [Spirochaetia bacterium]
MVNRDKKRKLDFTVFQKNTNFRGSLSFKKPLRILGKFEGDITGEETLEIGHGAHVEAHIETTHLIVYGSLIGNVSAIERVELKKGAKLIGNIRTPNLEVDDGVIFEGQCEMEQKKLEVPEPAEKAS